MNEFFPTIRAEAQLHLDAAMEIMALQMFIRAQMGLDDCMQKQTKRNFISAYAT